MLRRCRARTLDCPGVECLVLSRNGPPASRHIVDGAPECVDSQGVGARGVHPVPIAPSQMRRRRALPAVRRRGHREVRVRQVAPRLEGQPPEARQPGRRRRVSRLVPRHGREAELTLDRRRRGLDGAGAGRRRHGAGHGARPAAAPVASVGPYVREAGAWRRRSGPGGHPSARVGAVQPVQPGRHAAHAGARAGRAGGDARGGLLRVLLRRAPVCAAAGAAGGRHGRAARAAARAGRQLRGRVLSARRGRARPVPRRPRRARRRRPLSRRRLLGAGADAVRRRPALQQRCRPLRPRLPARRRPRRRPAHERGRLCPCPRPRRRRARGELAPHLVVPTRPQRHAERCQPDHPLPDGKGALQRPAAVRGRRLCLGRECLSLARRRRRRRPSG